MDVNLIKHILMYSGVSVVDYSEGFDKLYGKLSEYFLTPDNVEWFRCRRLAVKKAMPRQARQGCKMQRDLFWELFSFGRLDAYKNIEAGKLFDRLNINQCYLLQVPEYNLVSNPNPVYYLKGEYDISLINDEDREMLFVQLKEDIKKNVSIPFWVIDSISSYIGKEIYVFDESMNWVLALTHEKEVYLSISANLK